MDPQDFLENVVHYYKNEYLDDHYKPLHKNEHFLNTFQIDKNYLAKKYDHDQYTFVQTIQNGYIYKSGTNKK